MNNYIDIPPIQSYFPLLNTQSSLSAINYIVQNLMEKLKSRLCLTNINPPPLAPFNDASPSVYDLNYIKRNDKISDDLFKWSRLALLKYNFKLDKGLLFSSYEPSFEPISPINASTNLYVRFEKHIDGKNSRSLVFFIANDIVNILKTIQNELLKNFNIIKYDYPKTIFKTNLHYLSKFYHHYSLRQIDDEISHLKKVAFIFNSNSEIINRCNLNKTSFDVFSWYKSGRLIFFNPILNCSQEVAQIGISPQKQELTDQSKACGLKLSRLDDYHKLLIMDLLPPSLCCKINVDAICMLLLNKSHIGEVAARVWPKEVINGYKKRGINLL